MVKNPDVISKQQIKDMDAIALEAITCDETYETHIVDQWKQLRGIK
jgi:hypothetical protein